MYNYLVLQIKIVTNVKTIFRVVISSCFLYLLSCTVEDKSSQSGIMNLRLAADYNIVPVTKANEPVSNAENPEVKDFAITILNTDSTEVKRWDKFSEFPQNVVLPVQSYYLKASYGNVEEEGFDQPYYEGKAPFTIKSDERQEVEVTCLLANVKITVEYSDAFKKYFKDYQTSIQSNQGKIISFKGDELRAAYLKPGNITIIGAYTKQDGKSTQFRNEVITGAKACHHYILKLDVAAGGQLLNISYDNTTEKIPLSIDISDGTLNMKEPFFTLTGYEPETPLSIPSYSDAPTEISALLTARGGISSCVLTVASECLKNQGWPESVDLLKASEAQLKLMTDLGLKMVGLTQNVDKMAIIDFTALIPHLSVYNESTEHIFTLKATDKSGKESAAVSLKIISGAFDFSLAIPEAVSIGSNEVLLPLTLTEENDISKVSFSYLAETGVWTPCPPATVLSHTGKEYIMQLPISVGNRTFQLKGIYNGVKETAIITVPIKDFIYTSSLTDADVWATKAIVKIEAAAEDLPRIQKYLSVYVKPNSGVWEKKPVIWNDNSFTVMNLDNNTAYQMKLTCLRQPVEDINKNVLDFTTEAALQVPNAGMEEWYNKKVYSGKILGIGMDIYEWFPQASAESESFWSTRNDLTNSQTSGTTCYYTSYSGTISTANAKTGTAAAEISTLGWGKNTTYTNTMVGAIIKNKTAGMLFIGEYNLNAADGKREIFGRSFAARPTRLLFHYKYKPIENESFKVYIVVENRDKDVVELGRGEFISNEAKNDYTQALINIDYVRTDLKATHMYMVFVSSTAENPAVGLAPGSYDAFKGYADSRYVGSVLTVDDIQLNYE